MARSRILFCLIVLCGAAAPLRPQSGTATGLQGTVADPAGQVIPNVVVTVTNTATREVRTARTDGQGYWSVRSLVDGAYRLTFENPGFKKLIRDGVAVTTGQLLTVNVALELGTVEQVVEVRADAEMVSTGSATVVRTLDQRELEFLPTSARNFTQLLVIKPGVSADISELLSNNNASISPSVNGARTTNNSFTYNGVDVTNLLCCNSRVNGSRGTIDEGGGSLSRNIAPAPETLSEVKLQTSLYDAATGRNGGGNFQLVSKRGTNDYHGSGYFYAQNDAFIANDFFYNRNGLDRQQLRRFEGGATIGGPVLIPGIYNGKDKTFFFGSYQRTDARTSYVRESSTIRRVPRSLTDDRTLAGIQRFAQAVWNPSKLGPVNLSALNQTSIALLQAKFPDGSYLIPSGSNGRNCRFDRIGETCEVVNVAPATYLQDQFSVNLDQQIGVSNRLSGRFFFTSQPSDDPFASTSAVSRYERREDTAQRTFSLTDTHVFGPSLINEFRGGYFFNRNDTVAVPYFTNEQFGIRNPVASQRPDLAQIEIRGDRDIGDRLIFGSPGDDTEDQQQTITLANTLSWTRGRQTLRLGGEFRRHMLDGDLREHRAGDIDARSWQDFLTVGYANPADRNRKRQLDMSLNYGETTRGFRMSDWSWFAAHDWRVTPSLTLNLGVRHEFFGWPYEKNGRHLAYDFNYAVAALAGKSNSPLQDGFLFASNFEPSSLPGTQGLNLRKASTKQIFPGDYNNLMPRAGFAWTPMPGRNVVLRGGYGIFYERMTGAFVNSLRQGPPFFREAELDTQGDWSSFPKDYNVFPVPKFVIGFDDGEPILATAADPGDEFEALETQMLSPDLATPYIQQWSLGVQWGIGRNWLIDVGYVGSKGTKLTQNINMAQAVNVNAAGFLPRAGNVPGGGFSGNYYEVVNDRFISRTTPPAGCDVTRNPDDCVIPNELRSPVLGFDEDEGANTLFSNSNSIYNSLQASLEKRFSSGISFNVNYTFSRSIDYFSDEGKFQSEHDQVNWRLNRGLSDFHRTHRMILSYVWDLPFRGNRLMSGWQIAGVGTFQSGRPFSVSDNNLSGYFFASTLSRPNLAPGATHESQATAGSLSSRVDGYLNRAAFQSSGGLFGNLGRNTVTGPAQQRLDVSISKLTAVRERMTLEFRAEAYNVTNTPNFRDPVRELSSGSFGQIQQMRGGPRVIQLGLKARF